MFVVSYVMIVAFQRIDRIIIYRSFAHSIEQLSNLDYLSREQIAFIERYLIDMLKDAACEVSKRKCKSSLGQMFSIESAMVKKTPLKWSNLKFKHQFHKIDLIAKMRYQAKNKVDWKKNKCVICKFPMKLEPTNYLTADCQMSFGDFIIRYEHKFLRNI